MSEFTCINRHELGYGEFRCKVCGGRVYYMDGLDPQESAEILAVDDPEYDWYEYEDDGPYGRGG